MSTRRSLASLGTVSLASLALMSARPVTARVERAVSNDNRTPAGTMVGDTLALRLTVAPVAWHLLGDSDPAFTLLAFAEEGKTPSIPGPLIRVRVGTPVRVTIRNPLDDTLVVRGLSEHAAMQDSVVVLPGDTSVVRFVARREGTYAYWVPAYSVRVPGDLAAPNLPPRGFDSQLAGAIVVDPAGHVPDDRVFVITQLQDRAEDAPGPASIDRHGTLRRQFLAINGRAWPHTERLRYPLGDSVRWRIVNVSQEAHPMHLHGFYFRVDSHGSPQADADSVYAPEQRRMAVTETINTRNTASITWSPDRPGGWLFHCHLTNHAARFAPIDRRDVVDYPSTHHDGDSDRHVFTGMNGLVLGITVDGKAARAGAWRPAKRLRLFVQSDSQPGDRDRRFGYVLQRGAEPRPDSVQYPGPVLVLTRGEPTSIEVVNRTAEPTAVHWHGIELESYFDGVAGWSGSPGRTTPAIKPGQRFEVRLTPRRAGTFMYHTHMDEIRQQYGGLVGALVVLEPGERWDPAHDRVVLISDGVPWRVYINGSLTPAPMELEVGRTYRLRLADIAVFRQVLRVRLVGDSTLLTWRPIAKDGFALPPAQAAVRPSEVNLPSGETADFEFTPDRPGEVALEVRGTTPDPLGRPNMALQGRLPFRVSPAAGGSEVSELASAVETIAPSRRPRP
ncbi:MAG TPA: multicopper oxidase domain-containing protein [Gemmatimonadales bacterium]|nr:multicopper oxidase domain-containing protein [Gemmatimonadales bacterium]